MIADDIIETVATHKRIQSAVEELVDDILTDNQEINANTARVAQQFECEIRGQTFDVEISFTVGTKKKH